MTKDNNQNDEKTSTVKLSTQTQQLIYWCAVSLRDLLDKQDIIRANLVAIDYDDDSKTYFGRLALEKEGKLHEWDDGKLDELAPKAKAFLTDQLTAVDTRIQQLRLQMWFLRQTKKHQDETEKKTQDKDGNGNNDGGASGGVGRSHFII